MRKVASRRIIRALNSRDLSYAIQKGLVPMLRGFFWQVARFRAPKLMFIGHNVRFVCASNLDFGRGVSIGANSYIETCSSVRCRIGDNVTLRENLWLQCRSGFGPPGAGLFIGRSVYIGPNAVLGVGGPIFIGDGCQIGARLTLSAEEHTNDLGGYTGGTVDRTGIKIGSSCWFGNNVTVLDGVEIGDGCVIGAGAVVTRSLPSFSKALGVPARVVGKI